MLQDSELTILYLTDNSLDPRIEHHCQRLLTEAADGYRIVSVSQRPIDFGDNYSVGDIGRSGLSINRQILAGLEHISTPLTAVAEHDCLYSKGYFDFRFFGFDFWYNTNVYLVQINNPKHPEYDGMFSLWDGRGVLSQLICTTDKLRQAATDAINILSHPDWLRVFPEGRLGEPGTVNLRKTRALLKTREVMYLYPLVESYARAHTASFWSSDIPNLDLRHGSNFTGPRRGKHRTYQLPHWGSAGEVMSSEFHIS